jgi:hypothetical protein
MFDPWVSFGDIAEGMGCITDASKQTYTILAYSPFIRLSCPSSKWVEDPSYMLIKRRSALSATINREGVGEGADNRSPQIFQRV